jgi:hypothetical protein
MLCAIRDHLLTVPGVLNVAIETPIVYMVLFNAGLYQVISFSGKPYFPGSWEPAGEIAAYFQANSAAVRLCAFLQFGSAIPLGIFTATMVSRLQFLGVRAAGPYIALFGGLMTVFNMAGGSWGLACCTRSPES